MIEVKHLLRKAYGNKLSTLSFNGMAVQVFQNYLPSNFKNNTYAIDGQPNGSAYVIIQNQTVDDDSTKCGVNQNSSIQLDVVTKYPATGGSTLLSELITNQIFALLYPNGGQKMDLSITGVNLWRSWLVGSRTIEETTNDSKIFRNILIFNHSIQQN